MVMAEAHEYTSTQRAMPDLSGVSAADLAWDHPARATARAGCVELAQALAGGVAPRDSTDPDRMLAFSVGGSAASSGR
jgi:hypothetical protein